jgi:hypothetical protein
MHTKERGFALLLSMFLISVLSVIGASLMFLSQTETVASMNYQMMSQVRYAAEGGIQKASNFLLDPAQYPVPTTADLLGPACNRTVSPVTCNNQAVILSASAKVSNYPVAAVQTAYNVAGQGTLAAGNATLTYSSYARLLGLQVFDSYGGGTSVVATWEITADGGLLGSPKAVVEILAMIETPKVPASSYGAFATDNTCGAVTLGGNVTVDSYDSTNVTGATVPPAGSIGGNVGTNGNLTVSGSVDVRGNLYTPRIGVGACSTAALTTTGHAQVDGSLVQLPATVPYPTPTLPGPSLLAQQNISSVGSGTCGLLGLTALNCSVNTGTQTITLTGNGLTLPSLSLSSHVNLVVTASSPAAQYNFNSINLSGGSTVAISATSSNQGALIGIVGKNPDNSIIATPVDFTGGTYASVTGCASCSQYDASMFQIVYGGTSEIKMTGNSGAAVTIYAPNALLTLSGTADMYGSLLAKRINQTGTVNIHYDRRLERDFYVAGYPMMGTFNWKRN